ncbi:MAG: hypothetical protein K2N41_03950 [Lachnospiraceae bacterium]|nr:hypothetical protein [Lachnospiraceae bacterium]MDE7238847.1 hypothetical protein [Lachnospiraceae bacterium]
MHRKKNTIVEEITFDDKKESQFMHLRYKEGERYVQSFINNIAFPKSLEELRFFIEEHGCYNVEDILLNGETNWTCPKWAKVGDIVFFMHSKTAKSTITKLRTCLNNSKSDYSDEEFAEMISWIDRGLELYRRYGGTIFAVGVVGGLPEYFEDQKDTLYHWNSPLYCDITNVVKFVNPIHISEFNGFIMVSRQSGITPVFGENFDRLKKVISKKNSIPQFLRLSKASSLPLSKIDDNNWYQLSNKYRRSFMLETQFRTFYVNRLLRYLSDIKSIYKECDCIKRNKPITFVDNVILFHKKYLPVEVKLLVSATPNINQQLSQYCDDDEIIIDKKNNRRVAKTKIYNNRVLVIDTEAIYMYKAEQDILMTIFDLDYLTDHRTLMVVEEKILEVL